MGERKRWGFLSDLFFFSFNDFLSSHEFDFNLNINGTVFSKLTPEFWPSKNVLRHRILSLTIQLGKCKV